MNRPPSDNAVALLLDAMLENPNDGTLQMRVLLSLIRMSTETSDREVVAESGCVQAAVDAMKRFQKDPKLLCKGVIFLGNLAFSPEYGIKDRIRQCGGIDLILDLMAFCDHDEDFLLHAVIALRNLTQGSTKYQTLIAKLGAIELLHRVLSRFHNNRSLQTHGVAVIGNLASSGLEAQKRIRECGFIELILNAMRNYARSSSLNKQCVSALKHVCIGNAKNQQTIATLGGVEVLTELLRRKESDQSLLQDICEALRFMCFEERVRVVVGRNGALMLVVGMLQENVSEENAEIIVVLLNTISNAIFSPDENKQIFVRCGGIREVLKILWRMESCKPVIEAGLRVFRNVSDQGGVTCKFLSEAGAFSSAFKWMEQFKGCSRVCEHVFALIMNALCAPCEEQLLGRSILAIEEMISLQLDSMPNSLEVQKLGRTLQDTLAKIKHNRTSTDSRVVRKKSLMGIFRRSSS